MDTPIRTDEPLPTSANDTDSYRSGSCASWFGCESESALKAMILDSSTDAILAHTPSGHLVYFNEAAAALHGCTPDEFSGLDPYGWVSPDELAAVPARVDLIRERGKIPIYPSRASMRSGRVISTEVSARLLATPAGEVIVSVLRDVTERAAVEEQIRHLAFHDRLTGLANRAKLEDNLRAALCAADRYEDLVGVIYLDLDDFKPVNDRLGHAVGDQVLCEVAARMTGCIRECDTVARLGGDEFLVLITRLGCREDLAYVARKLTEEIQRPIFVGGREVVVTSSDGLALYTPGELPEDLTTRADHAMYRAKQAGVPGWEAFLQGR